MLPGRVKLSGRMKKKTIFPQRTGTDRDDRWCIEFGRREDADKDGNGRRLVVGDREQTG